MSIYKRILDAVKLQVINEDLLGQVGNIAGVPPENVEIWHVPILTAGKDRHLDVATPGLLICPARTVECPASGGTIGGPAGSRNRVYYPVLLQLVDSCQDRGSEDQIESWLQWSENLRKYFHQQNLRLAVQGSAGNVELSLNERQDVMDERLFGFHGQCVSYLPLRVVADEPASDRGSI